MWFYFHFVVLIRLQPTRNIKKIQCSILLCILLHCYYCLCVSLIFQLIQFSISLKVSFNITTRLEHDQNIITLYFYLRSHLFALHFKRTILLIQSYVLIIVLSKEKVFFTFIFQRICLFAFFILNYEVRFSCF